MTNKTKKCCLCNEPVSGWGHNPWPLKKGKCCGICNDTKVVPARLMLMMGGGK